MSDILTSGAHVTLSYLLVGSVTAIVLVPLAWATIRVLRVRTCLYRHMIWFSSLIGVIVLPVLWLYGPKLTLAVLPARLERLEVTRQAAANFNNSPAYRMERMNRVRLPQSIEVEAPLERYTKVRLSSMKPVFAGAWLAGFAFMLCRLGVGWRRLRRICVSAAPLPENKGTASTEGKKPRVLLTRELDGPACFGVFRPVILLPEEIYRNRTPEILRMVLMHELAHIERRDYWTNLFQRIIEAMFFFHPLVWLASRRLTHEREQICDNYVLARGVPADDYTALLSHIAGRALGKVGLHAVALFEGQLLSRIRSLLDPLRSRQTRLSRRVVFLSAVIVVVALLVFGSVRLTAREASGEEATSVSMSSEDKPTQSLHEAARDGDLERVKVLLAAGADLHVPDSRGRTPLHLAASGGHRDVAALLIARGANVNASKSDESWTPLLDAACAGRSELVKLLLQHGAKVDVGDSYGYAPLVYALWAGDEEGVRALIAAGADVDKRPNKNDCPALFYSVWEGDKKGVRILLDAGVDVNAKDDKGWTPLHYAIDATDSDIINLFAGTGVKIPDFHKAALEGNLTRVKEFVQSGMDVDTRDKLGWTASYWAVSAGKEQVLEYLLGEDASVRVKTNQGRTLLHQASQAGLLETVKLLIAKGADVNAVADDGKHPLGDATAYGHEDVVRFLLASGADINLTHKGKGAALHAAAWYGHNTLVDFLIANGADATVDATNGTALYLAADASMNVEDEKCAEIVRKLLAKGADVRSRESRLGRTPLHGAARKGRVQTAKVLLAAGAEVGARDNEGCTPLHRAARRGQLEVVQVLLAAGADVNTRDNRGHTPLWNANDGEYGAVVELLRTQGATPSLYDAAARGDISAIQALISKGTDVNARTGGGATLLHVACLQGQADMAEFLVARGADVNIGTNEAVTPLHAAAFGGHVKICELLISKGAAANARSGGVDVGGNKDGGLTPLHAACMGGHAEAAELLLSHGADANAKTRQGRTPLTVADKRGSQEIVDLLRKHGARE